MTIRHSAENPRLRRSHDIDLEELDAKLGLIKGCEAGVRRWRAIKLIVYPILPLNEAFTGNPTGGATALNPT